MNGDVAMLCAISKQGISFWQLNTFDWQIQQCPIQKVEQHWFLASDDWRKQSQFNKAIQQSAWGQEIPSRLACVTLQHELYVVDVAKGHIIWPIRKVQAYDITSLCFLQHDELLCIGTKNGQLKIFQLAGEKQLRTLTFSNPIIRMAASKDDFLAVQLDEHRIAIVSQEDEEMVDRTLEPFDFGVTNLSFSPLNHSLLAVAGDDGSLTVVNVKSTERFVNIQFSSVHLSPVSLIAFSPTNSCLLCSVGLDKRLCFFDIEKKKKRIRTFSLNDFCECLQFMNSGSHLIISFQQGRLSLFDLRGGIEERSSIATSQVIQSIVTLDKALFERGILRNEKDNIRISSTSTLCKSEMVDEEKENVDYVSNRIDDNQHSFQSHRTIEGDSGWTDKLLLDDSLLYNESRQLGSLENGKSLECSRNHLSESMIAIHSGSTSTQKREEQHFQRTDLEEEADSEYLPTKGNFSRPFSTSWDETPILAASSSQQQVDEKVGQIADRTQNEIRNSASYLNPFQCLLQDSPSLSYQPRCEQLENQSKDLATRNIYSGLLESIEDIQYANNREIKQHIQNLHIDVIRNFEEQQNRIQDLEQLLQKLMKQIELLEHRAQQDRILFPSSLTK
ncbi:hypothetical protein GpartN1_g6899.t1 [Galdieria partita]|uniref:Anaphase-promoting complex subunit 4-like WD40 domain-containing protein n=1 Tax=Galdieria partita TaxID=83374 RepID=A0A9C7Q262_9RHOD|nr:hypothetical protein GpartN1_g6899.t1 [Galdieria partita]